MPDYFVGLISGTSLDAIDAAVVDFGHHRPQLIHAINHPIPTKLRAGLLALCQPGENEIERMGELDVWLGETLADAVHRLLEDSGIQSSEVCAIGSHGQTIRHLPRKKHGFTLQIGDPNHLAELTGITTVADFRRRDMAAGGQAAPLVPAFHHAVFRSDETNRVILNIGGISNITALPANDSRPVTGFDTGPGNVLMDGWIQRHLQQDYDADGAWAASGTIINPLLDQLMADKYLRQIPPKSTGREHFHLGWLDTQMAILGQEASAVDVQATLNAFTAHSIADALRSFVMWADGPKRQVEEVFVCGGGARNKELMRQLSLLLAPRVVHTTDTLGIAAEWVEASAFAWLARETLAHRPGNLPSVTGARRAVILGGIYPGT